MSSPFTSRLAKQMEDMLNFKEALGYSRSSYFKFLLNFDRFCGQRFPNESVLTKVLVMDWGRMKSGENANGVKRRLIAIREFGKYLNSIGIEAYVVPTEMIGSFKPFIPYIYTESELSAFFHATDHISARRNSPLRQFTVPVLFRLLYCCGLRPSEIKNIRRSDINLETGVLFIRESKMHKDRTVVVSPDVLALCCRYDAIINTVFVNREYFFQDPNGNPYTACWTQKQFWRCWDLAGVSTFHGSRPRVFDFRHNYATRMLQKWMDDGKDIYACLPYLSAYMGHSDFSETAYYIHLLPERLTQTKAIDWKRFEGLIPVAIL
ncbi:MAG: tyrosine-type recombinase/integrase [Peptococcaceae bacterium]|nr:tyrosine-type recombinase/integrase [Peptococcaceae bacterium]